MWIAGLGDGTLGFSTATGSWKVKRLRNDNRVLLQPSDARGNPRAGTEPASGTAVVVEGPDLERVQQHIEDKYGYQFHLMRFATKVMSLVGKDPGPRSAVIITLDD